MDLQKTLDLAKKAEEQAGEVKPGKTYYGYENYMTVEAWRDFVTDMEQNHNDAYRRYDAGGGSEMQERKGQKAGVMYPPKMASYGSSSRMIYRLAKDIKGFWFEEQLGTSIGRGKANLDGYMDCDDRHVFVEAKCREPYGTKTKEFEGAYKEFYAYLDGDLSVKLGIKVRDIKGKRKIEAVFSYDEQVIEHFDMKQMLSHLLGIGTAILTGTKEEKPIDFLYLLYRPDPAFFDDEKTAGKIIEIYDKTCKECQRIDFQALYGCVLRYLQEKKGLGKEKDAGKLQTDLGFSMCDQRDFVAKVTGK